MNTSLSAVILFVNDTDRLKSFYTGLFGMTVAEEIPGEWVLLRSGKGELGLHKAGAGFVADGESNNVKLVYDVPGNLEEIREDLLSRQVTIGEVKNWDNYPYFVCDGQDPEGNVFQLRSKKAG